MSASLREAASRLAARPTPNGEALRAVLTASLEGRPWFSYPTKDLPVEVSASSFVRNYAGVSQVYTLADPGKHEFPIEAFFPGFEYGRFAVSGLSLRSDFTNSPDLVELIQDGDRAVMVKQSTDYEAIYVGEGPSEDSALLVRDLLAFRELPRVRLIPASRRLSKILEGAPSLLVGFEAEAEGYYESPYGLMYMTQLPLRDGVALARRAGYGRAVIGAPNPAYLSPCRTLYLEDELRCVRVRLSKAPGVFGALS